MSVSSREVALLDRWQHGFPLAPRPFALAGRAIECDEAETIRIFRRLHDIGVLSRIGAIVRPNTAGASTLAAMQVPADALQEVADIVSREPLVNHNYERTHAFNLWFVVAGPDTASVAATLARVAAATSLDVLDLRLERAYHLDLGFPLIDGPSQRPAQSGADDARSPEPFDGDLLAAIEDGLPMVARPYQAVARGLGIDEACVLERLRQMAASGIVRRFGCVVRHRALGYTANAMAVWDVADHEVDRVAAGFARHPRVTLCYRRTRRLPAWPYNLFCMVHAKSKADALAVLGDLNQTAGIDVERRDVLFSTTCFKQRGPTFTRRRQEVH